LFFLPAFGYLLLIMGTGLFLLYNWDRVREAGWGDRRVVGCLLVIALAIALSGANYTGWQDRAAPLGMSLVLLALYLAARVLGKDVFLPLAVGAGVASLGIIAHQLWKPGEVTGGFVFEQNYDIAAGYVILGTALFLWPKYQWLLVCLTAVAMFASGSPEAVFAGSIVGAALLVRKDWGPRIAVVIVPLAIVAVAHFASGYGQQLYSFTTETVTTSPVVAPVVGSEPSETNHVSVRLDVIKDAMSNIKPLGSGYILTDFSRIEMVHNVPLVLVQQLGYPGVMAAAAWLWVAIFCFMRTRWKYAWVLVLALSVFDHYIWTQLAPWWWAIVGASTADNIKADYYIFRKEPVYDATGEQIASATRENGGSEGVEARGRCRSS